jgi:hypothetical protein
MSKIVGGSWILKMKDWHFQGCSVSSFNRSTTSFPLIISFMYSLNFFLDSSSRIAPIDQIRENSTWLLISSSIVLK